MGIISGTVLLICILQLIIFFMEGYKEKSVWFLQVVIRRGKDELRKLSVEMFRALLRLCSLGHYNKTFECEK